MWSLSFYFDMFSKGSICLGFLGSGLGGGAQAVQTDKTVYRFLHVVRLYTLDRRGTWKLDI